jgi:DNA modification methylase
VGKNKNHPAVFPVDLPAFFIQLLSPKRGLVVDPFSGSGTTGIAALECDRNCVLIDNNEPYHLESIQRLRKEVDFVPANGNEETEETDEIEQPRLL